MGPTPISINLSSLQSKPSTNQNIVSSSKILPYQHFLFFIYLFYSPCLLFSSHATCPELTGKGLQQFRLLSVGSHKRASLGGAGWHFSWTQAPFSLASSFLWSFSFRRFWKLSWLLECLMCSIRILILLARIFPLTCLQWCQQHAGQHCSLFQFCYGNVCRAFLFEQNPLPWYLRHRLSCRVTHMRPKEQLHVSERPREHAAGARLLPFALVILARYWKMVALAERKALLTLLTQINT